MNWFSNQKVRYMALLQYAQIITPKLATREVYEKFNDAKTLEPEMWEALCAYTMIFVECGHEDALTLEDILGLTLHEKKALQLCVLEVFKNKKALGSLLSDPATRQATLDPDGVAKERIKAILRDSCERLAKEQYYGG